MSAALMNGCSMFTDEYSCGAIPEAECRSVSEVYEQTSSNSSDYRKSLYNKKNKKQNNISLIEVGEAHRTINYVNVGDPILTKPVVMRVLYRSFKNESHDLDAGGYVYLKMKESQWVLEK